jgi:YHS domain-containing protein
MRVDRREPGAVQFSPAIETGVTREGETLAAGSSTLEQPKCIVTGGAATMTLTYQGRTFPICCTGCRDEFQDNPEKYIRKAALIVRAQAEKPGDQPVPSRASRRDDAFAGDVVDSPSPKANRPAASAAPSRTDTQADASQTAAGAPKTAPAKQDGAKSAATRAAGLLRIAQNLEKSAKTAAALGSYRRIVAEYPNTAAAKTAAQRIKALAKP